jgi:hypothetical protein
MAEKANHQTCLHIVPTTRRSRFLQTTQSTSKQGRWQRRAEITLGRLRPNTLQPNCLTGHVDPPCGTPCPAHGLTHKGFCLLFVVERSLHSIELERI